MSTKKKNEPLGNLINNHVISNNIDINMNNVI